MTNASDEDKLDGNFGRRRGRSTSGGALFPDVSVSGPGKRAKARSRAAWFNRTTGAGAVKLAAERFPINEILFARNFFAFGPVLWVVARSGGIAAIRSPAETEKFVREQYELYSKLVSLLGIRQ